MRPAIAFIIFVFILLLCLFSLYYAILFHFELEALNSMEVISSAELTLAHYKHAVAVIVLSILIIATLFAFGVWCHIAFGD